MAKKDNAESLRDMANIGEEMERRLKASGIATPNALWRAGSVGAALRVVAHCGPDGICRSALSGLEGAIRGVRWHSIPKEEREALWNNFQEHLKP